MLTYYQKVKNRLRSIDTSITSLRDQQSETLLDCSVKRYLIKSLVFMNSSEKTVILENKGDYKTNQQLLPHIINSSGKNVRGLQIIAA